MKRSLLLLALLLAAACGPAEGGATSTTAEPPTTTVALAVTTTTVELATTSASDGFPVTIEADNGLVTIDEEPERIVSLSSVATEMLFAVGAGDQVVAVDDQSNYPAEAPMTDLSGFTPNVEAILGYEPDVVFISYDPADLVAQLSAAGVPVLNFGAAATLEDVYRQIEAVGAATGHGDDAIIVNEQIATDLDKAVADAPQVPEGTDYYHEVDNTFYTLTSSTLFGSIYTMFGLDNIADEADPDGFGYPQLSSEYIVESDPDLIFLANTLYGETAETVAARPGWGSLSAVEHGTIVGLDSDVASRWGPRIVEFAQSISAALEEYVSED
jgi:iron complex transport system substrate-binding protein